MSSPVAKLSLALAVLLVPMGLWMRSSTHSLSLTVSGYADERMRQVYRVLAGERERRGMKTDETLDPNRTGLIGVELSELTTTYGRLGAKRTAVQPAWAAVIAEWLLAQGLKPGDAVAIAGSGSFPGLVLATHVACESIGARPVSCVSLTASMYGANEPEWTLLEMFHVLRKAEILHTVPAAFSLGGEGDRAEEVSPELRQRLIDRIGDLSGAEENPVKRYHSPHPNPPSQRGEGVVRHDLAASHPSPSSQRREGLVTPPFPGGRGLGGGEVVFFPPESGALFILEDNLSAAIEKKWSVLTYHRPKAFINVGGSQTSLGSCRHSETIPPGDLKGWEPCTCGTRGLIARLVEKEVPTLHLLNIERLALDYGLPWDPMPFSPQGRVPVKLAWWQRYATLLALVMVWAWLGCSRWSQ